MTKIQYDKLRKQGVKPAEILSWGKIDPLTKIGGSFPLDSSGSFDCADPRLPSGCAVKWSSEVDFDHFESELYGKYGHPYGAEIRVCGDYNGRGEYIPPRTINRGQPYRLMTVNGPRLNPRRERLIGGEMVTGFDGYASSSQEESRSCERWLRHIFDTSDSLCLKVEIVDEGGGSLAVDYLGGVEGSGKDVQGARYIATTILDMADEAVDELTRRYIKLRDWAERDPLKLFELA